MVATNFPSLVLVVDDERVVLDVLVAILKRRGMQYVTASSGEEALAVLENQGVGCLLVDKNLPGINGLELIRRTRKLQPHCACILMTGYASLSSAVEAIRLGATDYLEKPFDDVDLVTQKLERAMSMKRTEAERDALLAKVRAFQSEVQNKDEALSKQQTEIQLFNDIIEARVKQATEDLRKKTELLEKALLKDDSLEQAVGQQLDSLIEYARGIQFEDSEDIAVARGVLARIVRKLENLATLANPKLQ